MVLNDTGLDPRSGRLEFVKAGVCVSGPRVQPCLHGTVLRQEHHAWGEHKGLVPREQHCPGSSTKAQPSAAALAAGQVPKKGPKSFKQEDKATAPVHQLCPPEHLGARWSLCFLIQDRTES